MDSYTLTDLGLERSCNQDAYSNYFHPNFILLAICDGMGGHQQGEVASQLAVKAMQDYVIGNKDRSDYQKLLTEAVEKANLAVYAQTDQDPTQYRMGTTVVACIIDLEAREAYVAHVGDSRFYLFRDGQLEQITRDHSLVEDLVTRGVISKEDAKYHPDKSTLTRALGMEEEVEIDLDRLKPEDGDVFLLCTDGLTNMVDDEEIAEVLASDRPNKAKCEELIDRAKQNGGFDNITATVFQYRR